MTLMALLPSPTQSVWHLGPIAIRAYALTMIAGMVAAGLIGARRLGAAGHKPDAMWDVAIWGIPFGIVGARLYHVVTSPAAYFGPDGDPWKVFAIWQGGLGLWGSIALGAVGGLIGARRAHVPAGAVADALAPGLAVAQAVGRLGNWFNQELFGGPTDLPWGLQVSPAVAEAAGYPAGTLFHPTFLYELLWDLGVATVLIWAGRRWRLAHGQVFFAYMALYCLGRGWIEALRIDDAQSVLGLRLNVWTAIVVGLTGLGLFVWSRRRHRHDATAADDGDPDPGQSPKEDAEDAKTLVEDQPATSIEPPAGEPASGADADGEP
jgi:prolipoprotein diacylglyceryl transferase